jgi:hypothetical protein
LVVFDPVDGTFGFWLGRAIGLPAGAASTVPRMDDERTFLIGEPDVTVQMLTALEETPEDDFRCLVAMTRGDETVAFVAGWTVTAYQDDSLGERLVKLAQSFPDDEFRLRNVAHAAPHIFGSR